ncbi:PREDICTED: CBL-interacting serine/threonine-protein kinase 4-like [Nelumbo nucifera]|uniref:non-specific serine/threonine protein kinase n=1 Tax=Nelumbo nucifera TaxID=4432 RepID=A0A1U8BD42_NELNU|nr:PREDICTED: CBL-interacting serine/threonine-protein kinase 4-like [Nelumbo nucifera]
MGLEIESSAPISASTTTAGVLLGKYRLGRVLGRGSFAKVYHARSLADDADIAIKVIDKRKVANTTMEPRIIREISVMHRLRHPNVVRIHEVMATKSKIYLVMEYAEGGELLSKISRHGRLTEPTARRYFQQLVLALHFCHRSGVVHRDIKPQNLLLDHEDNLKVSDFGLSALSERLNNGLLHTACGTPAYTAPEVVASMGYDGTKADAWSCGVILFVLLAGFLPFNDANLTGMYRKMQRREFQFPSWFSKPAKWVIVRLLDPNPETRISIQGLIEVSWFKKSFRSNGRRITPVDLDPVALPKEGKLHLLTNNTAAAPAMNAFDIISLSSGLDLSGLFEEERKRSERFTSTVSSGEKIVERVTEVGEKLGYMVQRRKDGVLGLEKARLIMSVRVLELAHSLFLVEVERMGEEEAEVEEADQWRDLRVELQDIVFAWHGDGVSEV